MCNDGCLRAIDVMIVGMRASVCGYVKDSAFALRDSGARVFTGEGDEDRASALRCSGALCCLLDVTLLRPASVHGRYPVGSLYLRSTSLFRQQVTSTSSLWTASRRRTMRSLHLIDFAGSEGLDIKPQRIFSSSPFSVIQHREWAHGHFKIATYLPLWFS